jgi:hypothetical protein
MDWKNEFLELLFPSDEKPRKEKEAYELKYTNRPKSIFKFRGVNQELFQKYLEEINDEKIWIARPDSFNDPYEFYFKGDFQKTFFEFLLRTDPQIKKDIPAKILEEIRTGDRPGEMIFEYYLAKGGNFSKETLEVIQNNFKNSNFDSNIKYMKDTAKVSCFSERNDSIPMWAHYADEHKGFCVEYDIYDQAKELIHFLFPVLYTDKISDVTKELSKGVVGWGIKPAIIKSRDWSYEKEWRFITSTPPDPPYKGVHVNFFPIKGIYLGTDIEDEHENKLIEIAVIKNIPIYEMKMSETKFSFESRPFNKFKV